MLYNMHVQYKSIFAKRLISLIELLHTEGKLIVASNYTCEDTEMIIIIVYSITLTHSIMYPDVGM